MNAQRLRTVLPAVWELMRPRRGLLALGFLLMVINRVSGLVLPYSTKFLIDSVIAKHHVELLRRLVLVVLSATIIQGITSFALTQLLSKAAQRLIAELRQKVQAHISHLPVAFYDSNKTGTLVSRIMNDVEGVRNLLGTGLVDSGRRATHIRHRDGGALPHQPSHDAAGIQLSAVLCHRAE